MLYWKQVNVRIGRCELVYIGSDESEFVVRKECKLPNRKIERLFVNAYGSEGIFESYSQ